MARDPYQELGVPRGAGEDEIRKAFRNLAKKHHPDANPGDKAAEERFKRVSAAFDILGDPDKRKKFDAGEIDADGHETGRGFGGGWSPGGFEGGRRGQTRAETFDGVDLGDILGEMFGGRGGGARGPGAGFGGGLARGADVRAALRTGVYLAAFLIPVQILVGDMHGLNTLAHQPAKVAAMEGIWGCWLMWFWTAMT